VPCGSVRVCCSWVQLGAVAEGEAWRGAHRQAFGPDTTRREGRAVKTKDLHVKRRQAYGAQGSSPASRFCILRGFPALSIRQESSIPTTSVLHCRHDAGRRPSMKRQCQAEGDCLAAAILIPTEWSVTGRGIQF